MNLAALGALVFIFILAYGPVVRLVYRSVRFRPLMKFIYGFTAAPVFLLLLVVNISVVSHFWPDGLKLLDQARPFRHRGRTFLVLSSLCVVAIVGSWIWYRFYSWLNREQSWDSHARSENKDSAT